MKLEGPLPPPKSRLLGLEETATYLGVTPRSVHRLVKRGLLSPV